jgi:SAM-dependent methyltransferase
MSLPDFSRRADLSEWMDDDDVDLETFRGCLRDLAKVNVATLAYRPTLAFLDQLHRTGRWPEGGSLEILDVGSGYGDSLRRIDRWAARRGLAVKLTGVDRNPWAARSARAATDPGRSITWLTCDVFDYCGEPDVILSALFTHHLDDDQLVRFLAFMDQRAKLGWLINDLERHPLAWGGFAVLARLMRWHPFVRHDGPVSIRRAFAPADWRAYLAKADVGGAIIRRRFPFRLCVSKGPRR